MPELNRPVSDTAHEDEHREWAMLVQHSRPEYYVLRDITDCKKFTKDLHTKILKLQRNDLRDRHLGNASFQIQSLYSLAEGSHGIEFVEKLKEDMDFVTIARKIDMALEKRKLWMGQGYEIWMRDGRDVYLWHLAKQSMVESMFSETDNQFDEFGCDGCVHRVWLHGFDQGKQCKVLFENSARVTHYAVQQQYFLMALVLKKSGRDPTPYLKEVAGEVEYCYDIIAAIDPDNKIEDVSLELEEELFQDLKLKESHGEDYFIVDVDPAEQEKNIVAEESAEELKVNAVPETMATDVKTDTNDIVKVPLAAFVPMRTAECWLDPAEEPSKSDNFSIETGSMKSIPLDSHQLDVPDVVTNGSGQSVDSDLVEVESMLADGGKAVLDKLTAKSLGLSSGNASQRNSDKSSEVEKVVQDITLQNATTNQIVHDVVSFSKESSTSTVAKSLNLRSVLLPQAPHSLNETTKSENEQKKESRRHRLRRRINKGLSKICSCFARSS